ncbi:Nucleoporin p58/p45 [Globomyces sp. JEL0801]|nr:Nucleoporin p58/p45 [Globomyces sp. JEL0801]
MVFQFGQTPAAAPTPTGGLFGGTNTATTGGGLFGKPSTPATGGLFGQSTPGTTNTTTPANTTTNTFNPTPAATTTTTTGGLFGQSTPAVTTTTTGFGQSNTPAATTTTTGGLFGQAAPAATTTATTGGLFGQSTTAPATGLFGNKAPNTTTTLTNPSNTLQSNAAKPNTLSQVNQTDVTLTTKYSELNDSLKNQLDSIQSLINQKINASTSLSNRNMSKPLDEIVHETDDARTKLASLKDLLNRDTKIIDQVKKLVAKDMRHSDLVARFIDTSNSGLTKNSLNNDAYASYFANFVADLNQTMVNCRQTIEELEMNIRSVASPSARLTPEVIQSVIRDQYNSFIAVAGKVAATHDATLKAQNAFVQYQEKYLGIHQNNIETEKDSYSQMAVYLQPTASQQNAGNPATTGTKSLFGNTTTNTASNSLFGAKPAFGAATTTNTTNLFGASTANKPATTTTTTGGLFGTSTTTTAAPTLGVSTTGFGANNSQPATNLFGGSTGIAPSSKRSNSLGPNDLSFKR